MHNKALLIILDGWGIAPPGPGNAISQAETPFFDQLWQKYPHTQLEASGEEVGLPKGQMGTSEVNHFAIGAGQVVKQDLTRINQDIKSGNFQQNPTLLKIFQHVQKNHSTLYVWGIIGPGGVHSFQEHLLATVRAAKNFGLTDVCIHAVSDGRDTSPASGINHLKNLEAELEKIGVGRIASLVGRYYAMDRDKNMERTDLAKNLYLQGQGKKFATALEAIQASYEAEITDEFVKPAVIGQPCPFKDKDGLVMVNFRSDRPQQILERILTEGPTGFKIATMTQYQESYSVEVMYPPVKIKTSLGKALSDAGLKQLRITETEKYNHLTYFLNCKRDEPFEGEDRFMFDSYSDIPTHDQRPAMRAPDIAEYLLDVLENETYDAVFTNLCNADMVGHTGNIEAAIKGCEATDQALTQVVPMALEHGYTVLITADHGNAEEMLSDETGMVTAHSCNPVPLIVVSEEYDSLTRQGGTLIDMAPTIFKILGLPSPEEMTGQSFV